MAKFQSNQDLNKFIRSVCIAATIQSNNGEPADQVGEAIEERIAERHSLYLTEVIAPELDPNSPDFDLEAYKAAAIQAAKDMNAAISKNNAAVNTRNLSKLTTEEIIAALMELREEIFEPLRFFAQAGQAAAQEIGKALKEAGGTLDKRSDTFIEKVAELEPYLIIELENAAAVNPDFENYSIWDIYEIGFDENGEPTESIFADIIAEAKYRKVSYTDTEGTTEALIAFNDYSRHKGGNNITVTNEKDLAVTVQKVNSLDVTVDRLNFAISFSSADFIGGEQYRIATLQGDIGKGEYPVMLKFNYDAFDELDFKTSKKLDPYDEFIEAIATALSETNGLFTYSQICKTGRIGNSQKNRENVRRSMEKQRATIISINNYKEAENSNYTPLEVEDSVLPFGTIRTKINGKDCEALYLRGLPPRQIFAKARGQFKTIPLAVLDIPISKTHKNIGLMMYLIKTVTGVERGFLPDKVLFSTVYDVFEIKRNHYKDFNQNIYKILDHWKKENFIIGYTTEIDGITLKVKKEKKIAANKKKALKGKK